MFECKEQTEENESLPFSVVSGGYLAPPFTSTIREPWVTRHQAISVSFFFSHGGERGKRVVGEGGGGEGGADSLDYWLGKRRNSA